MKLLIKISIIALLGVVVLGGLTLATKKNSGEIAGIVDRFNPFVPKSELYVIAKEPNSVNTYGTSNYIQTAVDKDGNTREIDFNAIQKMTLGIYVKIKNKGAYVEDIEKVELSDIPQKAAEKLAELN
ncbi:YxeA family protein [Carnobacterium gallinarum]|uniref:YxeA family protein n=1 Tax=Carnobacterium gallinarum TaxID=2749 RepID=UPI0005580F0D|nr:YxeA family protein [Carnobacterium gallinarum]